MKVPWLRKVVVVSTIFLLSYVSGVSYAQPSVRTLTRKEALIVAESTEEAEHFYTMYDGRLKNCIEKEVIKPCETDWVTCIENAWVIQFTVGDVCHIEQDGRLGLTILVDALTGRVLSRFPEVDYFKTADYCLDDSDCICGHAKKGERQCYNFIAAQVQNLADFQCRQCQCVESKCILKNN